MENDLFFGLFCSAAPAKPSNECRKVYLVLGNSAKRSVVRRGRKFGALAPKGPLIILHHVTIRLLQDLFTNQKTYVESMLVRIF